MAESLGISVVIPVYNSAPTLRTLLTRLCGTLGPLGVPYEIVLVNDGSRDESWQQIVRLGAEFPQVRGIDLMRNYGQHNAVLCGIRAARFATIVTMDDDLQNPPEEIPVLLAALGDGYDVVFGTRARTNHGAVRTAGSRITRWVLEKAMGAPIATQGSSFRAFRTSLREAFADYSSPALSIDALLSWTTDRIGAVKVAHSSRSHGRSNYTLMRLITHVFSMVTGYSLLPLQATTMLGFAFTLVGVGILFLVLVNYLLTGGSVPGFTFLACIIAIFSGVQLFALGVFGEYLARMYFRTMGRPMYFVREQVIAGQTVQDE